MGTAYNFRMGGISRVSREQNGYVCYLRDRFFFLWALRDFPEVFVTSNRYK